MKRPERTEPPAAAAACRACGSADVYTGTRTVGSLRPGAPGVGLEIIACRACGDFSIEHDGRPLSLEDLRGAGLAG